MGADKIQVCGYVTQEIRQRLATTMRSGIKCLAICAIFATASSIPVEVSKWPVESGPEMSFDTVAPMPMAKPVFDGTFGANCPPCKEFGQTVLKKLYAADGIAEAVDFEMHSAVRSTGSPSKDHSWDCPDEDAGCPMTKWFLCAVDGWNKNTTTQDQRVNFLTCWDDAEGDSEAKAKSCAATVKLDFEPISKCATSDKAEALELAAAEYFEKRFPTHAHSGIFMVPHVFINGKELGQQRDYSTILKML